MNIEIARFNSVDETTVQALSDLAVRACLAQGDSGAVAETNGRAAANYTSRIIITALREIGVLRADFDPERLLLSARTITRESIRSSRE